MSFNKMNWTKLPGIEAKDVHQGCACCPTPTIIASMEKSICVGFGSAVLTKDQELIHDGEQAWHNNQEPWTFAQAEEAASKDPDHDWRVQLYGPLHGETYQRHGERTWVMIESNMGFA